MTSILVQRTRMVSCPPTDNLTMHSVCDSVFGQLPVGHERRKGGTTRWIDSGLLSQHTGMPRMRKVRT